MRALSARYLVNEAEADFLAATVLAYHNNVNRLGAISIFGRDELDVPALLGQVNGGGFRGRLVRRTSTPDEIKCELIETGGRSRVVGD